MSQSEIFEQAMNYIDERITTDAPPTNDIIDGLCEKFKYSNFRFSSFIAALTAGRLTLNTYINARKLYYATLELKNCSHVPIVDIALKYYSDQTAFTRAIKQLYGMTPKEIRLTCPAIPDNRLSIADCFDQSSILSRIIDKIDSRPGQIGDYEADLFMQYVHASEEYGFDTETLCLIADLAQRLDVSFAAMLKKCFEIDIEAGLGNIECIMPDSETALSLGISSSDDAYAICEYYHVKYVTDLDRKMVENYYNRKNQP